PALFPYTTLFRSVRRRGGIQILVRRISVPVIAQLRVDFRMLGIMKRARVVRTVLVPTPDLVWNRRSFFQGHSVQKRGDLFASRRVGQLLVCDRADDFVANRSVAERNIRSQKGQKQKTATNRKRNASHWM